MLELICNTIIGMAAIVLIPLIVGLFITIFGFIGYLMLTFLMGE